MFKVQNAGNYLFKCCTLDIETYLDNNLHKILCICFYDGKITHKFYISDYETQESMVDSLIDTLLNPKYHRHSIYIHNGSSFDSVFLLKTLSKRTLHGVTIDPTYKDGKFLNIKIGFKLDKKQYNIHLKDSLLLLENSLAKLAKQFNLDDKGLFTYSFPKSNYLGYIGDIPSYSFFDTKKVSLNQYEEYK